MEILFLWTGLLFAAVGVLIVRAARRDRDGAQRLDGEIAGYTQKVDEEQSKTFAPVVLFRHPRAGRCLVESPMRSNALPWPVGGKVRLLITGEEPMRARIDTRGMIWFGGVFVLLGGVFIILFFSIFSWSGWSLAVAAGVSAVLGYQAWQKKDSIPGSGKLLAAIRESTTSAVVPERSFDRSTLVPPAKLAGLRRRNRRASIIAAVIMLMLSAGGLWWSYVWSERRGLFLDRAAAADGSVVDMEASTGSDSTTYAPVVEYQPDRAHEPVRFRHPISSSHPSWRVGDRVRVLYDPSDPGAAMIDSGFWNRATPMIPGAIGALLLLLSLASLRSLSRESNRTA